MFDRFRKKAADAKEDLLPSDRIARIAEKISDAGLMLDTTEKTAPVMKTFTDIRTTKLSERYREFLFGARKHGFADIEQLVPFVNVPTGKTLVEDHADKQNNQTGAQDLLREFPPHTWGYYMPLSRSLSTLGEKSNMAPQAQLSKRRSDYRLNFILSGLEAALGGSLAGRSVADIACNWGGFSVEARLRGASRVLGFDIRPENIAKAKRVIAHFELNNIDMMVQDLFTYEVKEQFDIVLNLGLMYHISMPFEMMKKTYDMTREVAVFDTVTHLEAFSGFVLGTGEAAVEHAATAIGVELHPTYRGLIDLAYIVGFKDVIELHGVPDSNWPDFDKDPYGNKTRRCIVAFK